MKKSTLKLAFLSLIMTAMLFNCKDKNNSTDPETPDETAVNDIKNVTMPTVAIAGPAAVVTTPGSVDASAAKSAVSADMAAMAATGVIPASITAATSSVSGALSAEDMEALNNLSPDVISGVAQGGALPANLQAILTKSMANPALAAYLPKVTYPTVAGVALKGTARIATNTEVAKTAAVSVVDKVDKVLVSDNCVAIGQAAFDTKKAELDASKASQVSGVGTLYTGWIAPIAGAQTSCNTGVVADIAAQRTAAQAANAADIAGLELVRAVLGESNYFLLKSLYGLSLTATLSSLNTLEAADKQACVAKATADTNAANAARDKGLDDINAAYTAALAKATAAKETAIKSCHNQGSGQ